ncbi:MAG: DUF2147 domain-containing protein [Alphaproteobacteria bacterium]|nr:DUF2147 domain-containing protein [Alphaproteobacteria bacterium]MBU1515694.1 DUF2147 domain-containing protein [Alphaproteobacteria bacterium]MBU2096977.1 DUF2147 domain-containing protein [Alphaproteobacteria bacterium]MBU2149493.1 DUF2147 domain-containing protein [Alphaproteobacteria bacterium]MBU2308879.1 DUF2147 domain-containing protein [Alphaproteobacteria bacterium]
MRALFLAAGLTLAAAPALAADPVEGEWLTQAATGKVRIGPCPGKPDRLCGAISWLKNPAERTSTDVNNPDPKLKTRPILGMPMLSGFKSSAPGKWAGGKIYDPNSGKTYDSKLSINPNGTLKVEGCILMVCQAQTWKRG